MSTPILPPRPFLLRPFKPRHTVHGLIGASLGLLAFLFVGLLPAVLAGGSSGIQLAYAVLGSSDAPAVGVSTLAVLGVLAATILGSALFGVLGAAAGSAVGALNRGGAAGPPAP